MLSPLTEAVTFGIPFNNILTLFELALAVTKSIFPSALKSALIINVGSVRTEKFVAAAKSPNQLPINTDRLFEV